MSTPITVPRELALAALALALGGCSLMGEPWWKGERTRTRAPAAAAQPPPIATHRFVLESDAQDIVGRVQVTKSTKEDTLSDIARRFNLGYEELVRANPKVDPWLPGEGTEIVVPTQFVLPNAPREGLVVNVPAMRLFYYPKRKTGEPQVVYTHPIGIGKVGWKTPEGTTKVVRKQKDPIWRPTAAIRKEHKENGEDLPAEVKAGPDNPLGRYAMYLAWPTYTVHGTNKPPGVGMRSSHGCLRLYPEDIELLYGMTSINEKVRVVNQPYVFGWHDNELYLQAYGVLEDDPRDWKRAQKKLMSKALADRIQAQLKARNEQIDWDAVSALTHQPRGVPVSISRPGATVEAMIAAAPRVQNRVPDGASWDGKSDLPMDEQTFREMLSESDPQTRPATTPKPRG